MFQYMSPLVPKQAWQFSFIVSVAVSLFVVSVAQSAPLISEFCPDNETLIADSDGDFSDWIEIHNPDTTAVDLGGYALTDSEFLLQKWLFPSGVMLAPGEFLIVFASDKNRTFAGSELHTNFKLSAGGEYLALVDPAGLVVQEFAPEYPPMLEDQSFGVVFGTRDLLPPGALAETLVPLDGALGTFWTGNAFVSGPEWIDGEAGAGFGLDVPGISVRHVFSTVPIRSIADADALLADDGTGTTTTVLSETRVIAQTVNYFGNGGSGNFDGNAFFPGGSGLDFALEATGTLVIPTTGEWTFGSNNDDGARVRINGVDVILDDDLHGSLDFFGTIFLEAGVYPFEYLEFQASGGSGAEFFAAPGVFTSFNSDFRLVGDIENGGLETRTPPDGATTGSFLGTDLTAVMKDLATSAYHRIPFEVTDPTAFTSLDLSVRYSDGMVAYINGTEVYRSNVPDPVSWNSAATVSRPDPLGTDLVNISSAIPLLNPGSDNVLAIHGLSSPLPDSEFAIVPALTGARPPGGEPVVFETPTPGTINFGNESFGSVLDTGFSLDRGFYPNTLTPTVPFDVAITTATENAIIYYTTDGSEPSEENGTAYTGPISITGTTTLRAIGTKPGFIPTNVDTQTYIVLDDVITQSESPPAGWPSSILPAGQVFDYGMDPDIVNNADPEIGGVAKVKEALTAVPTLAISVPQESLNSVENGIYTNAQQRGFEWEREVSLELIYPEGYISPDGVTDDFQIGCGLRIRGGFSRNAENPKHSFRVFFRGDYGDPKLEYPLFGSEGTDIFDGIDLRSPQNNSWSFQNSPVNTFLRDVWSRDVQREMGQPYTRSRYYHLYLNGIYWGLYQTQERAEADYAESYFGGDELDYDVVKSFGDVTDGTRDAYERLFLKWQNGFVTDAALFDILGRNANGDVDPVNHEKLIDLDNLLDYMILTYFSGDRDGPGSRFSGTRPNNYFGIYNRTAPMALNSSSTIPSTRSGSEIRTWLALSRPAPP